VVTLRPYDAVMPGWAGSATKPPDQPPDQVDRQEVRFCRASDGVRLAYAIHGQGPPLVIASCWLSHLQYDWRSPVWRGGPPPWLTWSGAVWRSCVYADIRRPRAAGSLRVSADPREPGSF
jgi:hypothetical protein